MELQGEVIEIIYKNELNSYCIAVLKLDKNSIKHNVKKKSNSYDNNQIELEYNPESESEEYVKDIINDLDEELTIVGYLPFINIGDTLKAMGKFVEHQEYGLQFKVDTFEKMMPKTTKALERYLANCGIKGIGPATARNIVATFGEATKALVSSFPDFSSPPLKKNVM